MQRAGYPGLEMLAADGFGDWLAGFLDGEGSFWINEGRCRAKIALRYDDKPILEEIVARTGVGRVAVYGSAWRVNPVATWSIATLDGCQRLRTIVDRFPLRAKKRRDYGIWREAVSAWAQLPPAPAPGRRRSPERQAALDRLDELASQLRNIRAVPASG